jgi:glycosyltransferase involved in cell wall biosynthesis
MKRKVLFFFPHNPSPPRTGAHKRCLEMLRGLKELDCDTTLVSSPFCSETEWTRASADVLNNHYVSNVNYYEPTELDRYLAELLADFYTAVNQPEEREEFRFFRHHWFSAKSLVAQRLSFEKIIECYSRWVMFGCRRFQWGFKGIDWRFHKLVNTLGRQKKKRDVPLNSMMYSPPRMRSWFARMIDQVHPDVIVMNYAYWDALLPREKLGSIVRIIDTHDLVSLNKKMQQAVLYSLPKPFVLSAVQDGVVDEKFFENYSLEADEEEFQIYDQYDWTITLSLAEAKIVTQKSLKTKVSLITITHDPCYLTNQYSGPAVFVAGPNYFNLQGYLYFAKRVLPTVLTSLPFFHLQVAGSLSVPLEQVGGIEYCGFLPDLSKFYERARFAICPVFGGTGQQVKIVEAMAHGLPVVALRSAAERSPIRHEENGLIAENAAEFANYVVRLWRDSNLCHKLGHAARETIAAESSRLRLVEQLRSMLQ